MFGPEFITAQANSDMVFQRMADEGSRDAVIIVNLLLKRKDQAHPGHKFADGREAFFSPRPDRRANVVENGCGRLAQPPGQAKVEIRRIDENGSLGIARLSFFHDQAEDPTKMRKSGQDLEDTHGAQPLDRANNLDSLLREPSTADAEKHDIRMESLIFSDDVRSMPVSRIFTGDDQNGVHWEERP